MSILVKKGGMLTSVQDLGRQGFQRYGVIVSGVMDSFSAKMANILLNNDEKEAVLEMTVLGPQLTFQTSAVVCITGGDLHPVLEGKPLEMWKPVYVPEGSELSFKGLRKGCRAYLAVKGGFKIKEQMNSRSTYLRAGFGGYKGRKLENGDVLEFRDQTAEDIGAANWGMMPLSHQLPDKHALIRYIKGPQYSWFTDNSQAVFQEEEYTVLPNSDRMGYRLSGEMLIKKEEKELITEPAAMGTIQVPPDGQPIILMADRQTTGGYPKIGQVITADLPLVAQLPPHTKIKFEEITIREAQRLLIEEGSFLKQVKTAAAMKWRELQR
ncbi:biotin-dependent carboxyltransferase family protein [Fictibacillus aquaticus]|uniref:Carboxyltransferase domain-containing protein n=1 Tax=Fictibacillus aquaticus TaxID=2021314 RepID=A0A235FF43_9BACL|nr:biotin-dependent carboxyltransferase family protein [Fictibacillus aquaticus]OYD59613.1 hypothetical protein CGZ90_06930 [Fictibacillus aquaticus]